jgi:hypothetical protein
MVDMSNRYVEWYTRLLERIRSKEPLITNFAGREWYEQAYSLYHGLTKDLVKGRLGGAAFYLSPRL